MVDKLIIERMKYILLNLEKRHPDFLQSLRSNYNNPDGSVDIKKFKKSLIKDYFNSREVFKPYDNELCTPFFYGTLGVFIHTYKINRSLSSMLMTSFLIDVDRVKNSATAHKLFSLEEKAALVLRAYTSDVEFFHNESKDFIKAYSEFLGTIFNYWIICLKSISEVDVDPERIVKMQLSNKMSLLGKLAKSIEIEGDPINKVLSFLNVKLRNSIAHESIWINEKKGIVYYKGDKNETGFMKMSYQDYLVKVFAGLNLHVAYKAAISTIYILDQGFEIQEMPSGLAGFIVMTDNLAENRVALRNFKKKSNYAKGKLIHVMNKKLPAKNKFCESYDDLIAFLSKEDYYKLEDIIHVIDAELEAILAYDKFIADGLYKSYDKTIERSFFYGFSARSKMLNRLNNSIYFNHCELVKQMIKKATDDR